MWKVTFTERSKMGGRKIVLAAGYGLQKEATLVQYNATNTALHVRSCIK